MAPRLLILGAGGHGRAVADLAQACGFAVAGFTEPSGAGPDVVGTDDDLPELGARLSLEGGVVGVGATALGRRRALYERLGAAGLAAPALLHPRATASPSARLGAGTAVFAGSVLGRGVEIGANAVLYSAVVAEHDCRIGDHAWLSPGVVLAGGVTVEPGAFVGAGAVVVPGVTIGCDAVVAAGAVVVEDVRAGVTVVGVPARARSTA
ncbi:MAG TPA: NeuD/PglB/VioB family sugar acetyltransferase [Methylomirabilota bacterium]|nr:NeuD/PglB/VioB family sugar acetyltransferase [Methylomirabilota bacterium]